MLDCSHARCAEDGSILSMVFVAELKASVVMF